LYVADGGNNTIRKVVVATGTVTTLAGTAGMSGSTDSTGLLARFNFPKGVALDGAGNLNGNSVSTYLRASTPLCRSSNQVHALLSARCAAAPTRSAA
jgi:hypothetical protein